MKIISKKAFLRPIIEKFRYHDWYNEAHVLKDLKLFYKNITLVQWKDDNGRSIEETHNWKNSKTIIIYYGNNQIDTESL